MTKKEAIDNLKKYVSLKEKTVDYICDDCPFDYPNFGEIPISESDELTFGICGLRMNSMLRSAGMKEIIKIGGCGNGTYLRTIKNFLVHNNTTMEIE